MGFSTWVENEPVTPVLVKVGFALTSPLCRLMCRGERKGSALALLWDCSASDAWLSWSSCALVRTFPSSPRSLRRLEAYGCWEPLL